jgi:hypothetical protein
MVHSLPCGKIKHIRSPWWLCNYYFTFQISRPMWRNLNINVMIWRQPQHCNYQFSRITINNRVKARLLQVGATLSGGTGREPWRFTDNTNLKTVRCPCRTLYKQNNKAERILSDRDDYYWGRACEICQTGEAGQSAAGILEEHLYC